MRAPDSHRLDPLLKPRSIALVGASIRPDSVGNAMVRSVLSGAFPGPVYPVNPKYDAVEGLTCFDSLADLPQVPDLVVAGTGAGAIEDTVDGALEIGARAVVIFDGCRGVARDGRDLLDALRARAATAQMPVCGGNGMGYFNVTQGCFASFYDGDGLRPGGITLIPHSGSVFIVLALNDPRYRFNLVISAGQEIGAGVGDYIDFAVEQPETRVIAVFLEAARDPVGFCGALEKARERNIPVVVCKVGRTEASARLAHSHSGAITGNDAAYDAAFARYGAIRVDTVDQLMNTALLFSQGRVPGKGGLGVVTDSGGLREAIVDRIDDWRVPLAALSDETLAKLRSVLPAELEATNPVDAASSIGEGFSRPFADSLAILAAALEVAALGYEIDARDDYAYSRQVLSLAEDLADTCEKPCFVYSSFGNTNNRGLADRLANRNVPVLNGQDEMLAAVRGLFALARYRDAHGRNDTPATVCSPARLSLWRERLGDAGVLSEADALTLLDDFGIAGALSRQADGIARVRAAARELGFPVALKTAADGVMHKTEMGGVVLNITTADELDQAYAAISARLGGNVIVQKMVPAGVELAFGCVVDEAFGPVVMVAAGGVLVEMLADSAHALAPFGPEAARDLIETLAVSKVLGGVRGRPPCDVRALATALSRFSVLCADLGDLIAEVDVNPVIASAEGCCAADALVVCNGAAVS